jgi:hypothetical protein
LNGARGGDGLTVRLGVKKHLNMGPEVAAIFPRDLGFNTKMDRKRPRLSIKSGTSNDNHTCLEFNHIGVLGVKPPTCRPTEIASDDVWRNRASPALVVRRPVCQCGCRMECKAAMRGKSLRLELEGISGAFAAELITLLRFGNMCEATVPLPTWWSYC